MVRSEEPIPLAIAGAFGDDTEMNITESHAAVATVRLSWRVALASVILVGAWACTNPFSPPDLGPTGVAPIREDLLAGLAKSSWGRVQWPRYNNANGLTRPAVGR